MRWHEDETSVTSIHFEDKIKEWKKWKTVRLVVTEDHMTSKCTMSSKDRRLQEEHCVVQAALRSCCYSPTRIPSRCQHEEDHSLAKQCACECALVGVRRCWHMVCVLSRIWMWFARLNWCYKKKHMMGESNCDLNISALQAFSFSQCQILLLFSKQQAEQRPEWNMFVASTSH